MYCSLIILGCAVTFTSATEVSKCGTNIPYPLSVKVKGCEAPPCDIVKGTSVQFEVHFLAQKYITRATALVKAKTFGLTVPYELPQNVSDVCSNLMYEAFCPLYASEDVTYLFLFPIAASYPEISVNVQIYIVDQNREMVTCFRCDVKVKKGSAENSTALLRLDWVERNFSPQRRV